MLVCQEQAGGFAPHQTRLVLTTPSVRLRPEFAISDMEVVMPDKKPLTHRQLARRSRNRATASLLDIALDGVRGPRLIRKGGRLSLIASIDGNGIRPERRHERIPVTRLNAK